MSPDDIEYPDTAGYPDGTGFLDEGTASVFREAGSAEFVAPSADAELDLRVIDDPSTGEYRALVGDREVGVIRYERSAEGVTVVRSTYVEPELRGDGIGTAFIAHVLDDRRERGESVIVECPVIRRYVAAHPEYASVVVR